MNTFFASAAIAASLVVPTVALPDVGVSMQAETETMANGGAEGGIRMDLADSLNLFGAPHELDAEERFEATADADVRVPWYLRFWANLRASLDAVAGVGVR